MARRVTVWGEGALSADGPQDSLVTGHGTVGVPEGEEESM